MNPVSPIMSNTDLITFNIKSNGNPIKDTYQILSVYIESAINKIPFCEIEIADGNPAREDFPISNSKTFVPGAEIEILAGYENNNTSIFKGIVIQQNIQVSGSAGPVLRVICKDKAVKMTVGRKNAYFKDMTDSDIMSKLIGDNGLSADISSTTEQKEAIQYYSTDWDFMITRAEVNGMLAVVQGGKVSIKKPEEAKKPVLGLTYGSDIYDLDVKTAAQSQFVAVKPIKSARSGINGTVKFQGSAKAEAGTLIGLKGIGKRFEGDAYISGVVHDIREGNWITTAKLGLSPEWYATQDETGAPQATDLLPGIQGLQIGKVKQVHEDPDGEFRVLIKLPMLQSGDDGIWARLSTFYAGSGIGAFFYPEVDDEVIVGFLNDDPRYPIILGSVYSSGRAAPETAGEHNNTKAFVSREKMKISFDEEKKEITITTPANNQLVFSDEEEEITMKDQHNNFIKLSSNGIEINSASNLQITAAEAITIDGPTGITGSSEGGDISLSAISISCTADTEFSASGNASASLSASAEVSITGAMVMIN